MTTIRVAGSTSHVRVPTVLPKGENRGPATDRAVHGGVRHALAPE